MDKAAEWSAKYGGAAAKHKRRAANRKRQDMSDPQTTTTATQPELSTQVPSTTDLKTMISELVSTTLPSPHQTDTLRVQLLHADAKVPHPGTQHAAGMDITTVETFDIPTHGQYLAQTGLAFDIPKGHYGRIAPRSGLATKGVHVGAGVVDCDYRGEVKVLLLNYNDQPFAITKGDRIAQLILEKCTTPKIQMVDNLSQTERGTQGFGSTGGVTEQTAELTTPNIPDTALPAATNDDQMVMKTIQNKLSKPILRSLRSTGIGVDDTNDNYRSTIDFTGSAAPKQTFYLRLQIIHGHPRVLYQARGIILRDATRQINTLIRRLYPSLEWTTLIIIAHRVRSSSSSITSYSVPDDLRTRASYTILLLGTQSGSVEVNDYVLHCGQTITVPASSPITLLGNDYGTYTIVALFSSHVHTLSHKARAMLTDDGFHLPSSSHEVPVHPSAPCIAREPSTFRDHFGPEYPEYPASHQREPIWTRSETIIEYPNTAPHHQLLRGTTSRYQRTLPLRVLEQNKKDRAPTTILINFQKGEHTSRGRQLLRWSRSTSSTTYIPLSLIHI